MLAVLPGFVVVGSSLATVFVLAMKEGKRAQPYRNLPPRDRRSTSTSIRSVWS